MIQMLFSEVRVTSVAVNCVTPTVTTYTIGGTVAGLGTGSSVVLQNNAGDNIPVSANGAFTFTTPLANGAAYAVTVLTQPTAPGPGQSCIVTAGTGTVNARAPGGGRAALRR